MLRNVMVTSHDIDLDYISLLFLFIFYCGASWSIQLMWSFHLENVDIREKYNVYIVLFDRT